MSIIGTSVPRTDAPAKAAGKAKYAADYSAENMLHVALVRSKVPHAKITNIRIPLLPDDTYCYTAKDLFCNTIPSIMNDQPVFAEKTVRYFGEPIAAVAAPSLAQAKWLASQVEVSYEELPCVEDMQLAIADSSVILYEAGNLCSEFHSTKGTPEEVFPSCSLVLEDTYYLPIQTPGFLEPEAAFCKYEDNDQLLLISSTQNAFSDRFTISQILNVPIEKITSRAATVGGGFGGKDGNTSQVYAAMVTVFTGRPAKYVFSREENVRYGMKRHSAIVHVKIGFDNNGIIQAFAGKNWMDTGAYGLLGPAVLGLGTEHMTGPYYIPNVQLDGWLAYTNHTPASAMRGFGAPQTAMAVECLMNLAAEKLGIDSLELRRRNALHTGQTGPMGALMEHSIGFEDALSIFEKSDFYHAMQQNTDPTVAYGFAVGMMSSGMGKDVPDRATVQIDRLDDGFAIRVGLVDIGQGSETLLSMIASEALHVPMEKITMIMADTDKTTDSGSTAASRTTYVCGNAILLAAKELLENPEKMRAEGVFDFPELPGHDGVHSIFGFIVQGVKVTVDPLTGSVQVLQAHNTTEAGHILHPDMMAGQIFGGMAMSTGYSLSEQIQYHHGIPMEDGFNSYIMPTSMDAPHMTNDNVPFYEQSGPFGAKGVAEAATVALAPAVADAVHRLYPSVNIHHLPINRMEILRAIKKGQHE